MLKAGFGSQGSLSHHARMFTALEIKPEFQCWSIVMWVEIGDAMWYSDHKVEREEKDEREKEEEAGGSVHWW